MASPNEIWQGTDKDFTVKHDYSAMTTAAEIEVFIDTNPQIIKKLSEGAITAVTSSTFLLSVDDADTKDKRSGEYLIQARITSSSGRSVMGQLKPSRITIKDSVFTTTE